jgi:hypothetical protein
MNRNIVVRNEIHCLLGEPLMYGSGIELIVCGLGVPYLVVEENGRLAERREDIDPVESVSMPGSHHQSVDGGKQFVATTTACFARREHDEPFITSKTFSFLALGLKRHDFLSHLRHATAGICMREALIMHICYA